MHSDFSLKFFFKIHDDTRFNMPKGLPGSESGPEY